MVNVSIFQLFLIIHLDSNFYSLRISNLFSFIFIYSVFDSLIPHGGSLVLIFLRPNRMYLISAIELCYRTLKIISLFSIDTLEEKKVIIRHRETWKNYFR